MLQRAGCIGIFLRQSPHNRGRVTTLLLRGFRFLGELLRQFWHGVVLSKVRA
jgi:hypothetical protein